MQCIVAAVKDERDDVRIGVVSSPVVLCRRRNAAHQCIAQHVLHGTRCEERFFFLFFFQANSFVVEPILCEVR